MSVNIMSESNQRSDQSSRVRVDIQKAQKKWLELVHQKCQKFLERMKHDSKTDLILAKPFRDIYQIAAKVYKEDGRSLLKWISEPYRSDGENSQLEHKKDQFKNMLSLDIWIDRLAQWQANHYKLEMPVKEPVDPLRWNNTLKQKLKDALSIDRVVEPIQPPKPEVESVPYQPAQDHPYMENPRKRTSTNHFYPGMSEPVKETDQYRQLKYKKTHEGLADGHQSVISTDRTSMISAMKQTPQRPQRPQVSMTNLFAKIDALKKEIKSDVLDINNKNVVHLSLVDAGRIGVSQ